MTNYQLPTTSYLPLQQQPKGGRGSSFTSRAAATAAAIRTASRVNSAAAHMVASDGHLVSPGVM